MCVVEGTNPVPTFRRLLAVRRVELYGEAEGTFRGRPYYDDFSCGVWLAKPLKQDDGQKRNVQYATDFESTRFILNENIRVVNTAPDKTIAWVFLREY